jgi:hypothetical protein
MLASRQMAMRFLRQFEALEGPASLTNRGVLFLDVDNVACKNAPYGGHEVAMAFSNTSRATGL